MSERNDGGPAFYASANATYPGMTLRDYFAARAMQALIDVERGTHYDEIAKRAFRAADFMLQAREAK